MRVGRVNQSHVFQMELALETQGLWLHTKSLWSLWDNARNKNVNNFPSNEEWRIYKVQWDLFSWEMKIPYSSDTTYLRVFPLRNIDRKGASKRIPISNTNDRFSETIYSLFEWCNLKGIQSHVQSASISQNPKRIYHSSPFVKVRGTRHETQDARATQRSLSGFQFGIFTKVIKDGELCGSREETRERR
ncbi:hypothetical protein V1478_001101 [Vespula squamosa]|uniref:Uncharacterized protein n=1 Tax=Vespula squamosa TaxID=30214 RepID=A0ABD2C7E2_VESSQ